MAPFSSKDIDTRTPTNSTITYLVETLVHCRYEDIQCDPRTPCPLVHRGNSFRRHQTRLWKAHLMVTGSLNEYEGNYIFYVVQWFPMALPNTDHFAVNVVDHSRTPLLPSPDDAEPLGGSTALF